MKNKRQHLRHIQKKVIQETRRKQENLDKSTNEDPNNIEFNENQEALAGVEFFDDSKRKMTRDFVRHMPQRERGH